jgi:hypothetical protein
MSKSITIFNTDGTIRNMIVDKKDLLETLQGLVGGDICALRRDLTTISREAKPHTLRKKLYANDEGIPMGLPENPHFQNTHTRFREGFRGGMMTAEMFKQMSIKVKVPARGVVVAVGSAPK